MRAEARFVWFWSFWRWSRESGRVGTLLRDSLHGLRGNWDDWYRHSASPEDLAAIDAIGATVASQRQFIAWLLWRWAREIDSTGNRSLGHFVVTQLAGIPPFNNWSALRQHAAAHRAEGIAAVILGQGSLGRADDVRSVEALALPALGSDPAPRLTTEGFRADDSDLKAARQSAAGLLNGPGAWLVFLSWAWRGPRPYPRALDFTLKAGWIALAGLIAFLRFGPDPQDNLHGFVLATVSLWSLLTLTAAFTVLREAFRWRREGRARAAQLEHSHLWLRMSGGLTLKGGSAGLAFCLNLVLAVYRAHPRAPGRSWIWRRIFQRLDTNGRAWAATGVVSRQGRLDSVMLEPKLRACLQQAGIRHLLAPWQTDARNRVLHRVEAALQREGVAPGAPFAPALGYAASYSGLRLHRCAHAARALAEIGGLRSRVQLAASMLAFALTGLLLYAAHDIRSILTPPPAPIPLRAINSPLSQTTTLNFDSGFARYFEIVLESETWINRRVPLLPGDRDLTLVRAELPLVHAAQTTAAGSDDTTVWVVRRRWFIDREFSPGERVGRYTLSYLSRPGS